MPFSATCRYIICPLFTLTLFHFSISLSPFLALSPFFFCSPHCNFFWLFVLFGIFIFFSVSMYNTLSLYCRQYTIYWQLSGMWWTWPSYLVHKWQETNEWLDINIAKIELQNQNVLYALILSVFNQEYLSSERKTYNLIMLFWPEFDYSFVQNNQLIVLWTLFIFRERDF